MMVSRSFQYFKYLGLLLFGFLYFGLAHANSSRCPPDVLNAALSALLDRDPNTVLRRTVHQIGIPHATLPETFSPATSIATAEEAKAAINKAFDDPVFKFEFSKYLAHLGGTQSAVLWDDFFKAYDRVVAFSSGYLELIREADSALNRVGQIIDYGSGTGNFSVALLASSPQRKIHAIDLSPNGVALTQRKLRAVDPGNHSQSDAIVMDLKQYSQSIGNGRSSGAIMNNVLYSVGNNTDKERVLRRAFQDLKTGGILVLNDPKPITQGSIAELKSFLSDVILSAVRNGADINSHDIELLVGINRHVLTAESAPFSTASELKTLATNAGFEVVRTSDCYYHRATCLILRKP